VVIVRGFSSRSVLAAEAIGGAGHAYRVIFEFTYRCPSAMSRISRVAPCRLMLAVALALCILPTFGTMGTNAESADETGVAAAQWIAPELVDSVLDSRFGDSARFRSMAPSDGQSASQTGQQVEDTFTSSAYFKTLTSGVLPNPDGDKHIKMVYDVPDGSSIAANPGSSKIKEPEKWSNPFLPLKP